MKCNSLPRLLVGLSLLMLPTFGGCSWISIDEESPLHVSKEATFNRDIGKNITQPDPLDAPAGKLVSSSARPEVSELDPQKRVSENITQSDPPAGKLVSSSARPEVSELELQGRISGDADETELPRSKVSENRGALDLLDTKLDNKDSLRDTEKVDPLSLDTTDEKNTSHNRREGMEGQQLAYLKSYMEKRGIERISSFSLSQGYSWNNRSYWNNRSLPEFVTFPEKQEEKSDRSDRAHSLS